MWIHSGPHHGHYISLIKTLGSWFVFDDDVVDPIKESDIPKYFGDSNAGSAYVLYYQAVDIDLAGLGLRTSEPDPPEQLPTQITDPRSSPVQPGPALPPGLIDETESSEISDPSFPATPSQSYLPIPEKSSMNANPALGLKPNVLHAEEPTLSPNVLSPPTAGTSAIGGLFNSLRRGPSAKAKSPVPSWLESRKSISELPPRVPNVPPLPVTDEQQTKTIPPPSAPPQPLPTTNEKQRKEADKKTNTWFKRKNVKIRSETGSESSPFMPSSHADEDGVANPSATPLSSWRRSSGHTPKHSADESHRRPSEPILFQTTATPSAASSPLHSNNVFSSRRNGYDSPSAGSASSSLGSTSGAHPYKNVEFPKFSASSTHVHTLPPGAQPPMSPHHKRSLSQLSQKRKSHNTPGSPPPQLPPRPVTATDGVKGKSARSTHTVPPVPSLPPPTPRTALGNGNWMEQEGGGTIKGKRRDDEQPHEPHQNHHYMRMGHEHGANSSTSTSTTSSAGSNLKRVSRKLSLTAPILGFGRKDKDKDKERQKDKDRDRGANLPPSSFLQLGSR
jgi:ubiquitin carboxyl-terminal hydrolase 9/13